MTKTKVGRNPFQSTSKDIPITATTVRNEPVQKRDPILHAGVWMARSLFWTIGTVSEALVNKEHLSILRKRP